MTHLTGKQFKILSFIHTYVKANGYPPSIREIGDAYDISSLRGVTVHLDALERKGMLKRGHQARAICLTELGLLQIGAALPTLPEEQTEAIRIVERKRAEWNSNGYLYASAVRRVLDDILNELKATSVGD